MRVAVLGAGSWGTALAISLAEAGKAEEVVLWMRDRDAAAFMRRERHNFKYLPQAIIPDSVSITHELEVAAGGKDLWLFTVPSQAVRGVAEAAKPFAREGLVCVSAAKGIENGTLMTTTQVLCDVLPPSVEEDRLGVVYGPSHAEEVGARKPTTVVVAAHTHELAGRIQELFMSVHLRAYANTDVIGTEIAGSVKNVLAIAAGMSDGVGYGDNAKAALVTRGIAEIRRLGVAMGADFRTFSGLAGLGDLVVTCMSGHSRNRYLGQEIGKGRSLGDVLEEMTMVAEGVQTTRSVKQLARKHGVEMPICDAVHAILFEGKQPEDAVRDLMTREAKHEDWLPGEAEGCA
jgi:glycerol-3-phosphate dehydrogenase (NAD(P)+)